MAHKHESDWLSSVVGPAHRLAAFVIGAGVLAVGATVGVAYAAGFLRVLHLLVHVHWFWLGLAGSGQIAGYVGYTLAYREIARVESGTELRVPKAVALVATGFGVFLQGGGFALDREALRRVGLSKDEARSRVLGLGALEYAILAPATAVAAGIVYFRGPHISSSLTLPWLIGVPVGAVLALAALAFAKPLSGPDGWRKHVGHSLHALRLVLGLGRNPIAHGHAFVGILMYWTGDVFSLWATLHAFSADPPPLAQLIVGYATGYAITRRALPLGGAGIVEALLPFALGWVGIALAPAVLAVFAYRVFNLWLPMIPALAGIPAISRLEVQPRVGGSPRARPSVGRPQ